ncbi:Plasmodium exported protein, unknown function [Plasmodium ovale wallikeri]|uniref:Uncharacterized protein n=1 Tax=Plasmodium ovale wallikeri TaxID=864142 RepID=A0A1A9AKE8_PLAOA|nr:Plasmodium exported protein, unknown function [Plasmodium ovale wallikeri]SBT56669.1 Plasmodium exported protein, unknown function [Plasmodium ovale wallikeri]
MEQRYEAGKNKLKTSGRKLAQARPLPLSRKRSYDSSLTLDELRGLINILYCEVLSLNDLISSFIIFISKGNNPSNYDVLIREKVYKRLAIEVPSYPELKKKNMVKRLKEQMQEIINILPFTNDGVFYIYEFLKLELDESIALLGFSSRQRTEDERNGSLNDLLKIRERLTIRLMSNNIMVNDDMVTEAVLRIRKRVLDIMEYHYDKPSQSQNN